MENLVVRIKVSAEAATPVPAVTATPESPVEPTPTAPPVPTTGQICVQAYNDLNGDGQRSADEILLPGVVVTLSDASGPRTTYTTDGVSEPYCFADLTLGDYQLAIKPPANYVSTTPGAMTINLSAGIKPDVMYGARRGGPAPTPTSSPSDGGASTGKSLASIVRTVLIVAGVLVLIGFVAVGGFVVMRRRR
jgi:hypothetical protein